MWVTFFFSRTEEYELKPWPLVIHIMQVSGYQHLSKKEAEAYTC